jgi:hypothetical protein
MERFAIRQRTLICVIVTLLAAGCGGGQSPTGTLPQTFSDVPVEPDAATCPTPGKIYSTGNGRVSTQFGNVKISLGLAVHIKVTMKYKGWLEGRKLVDFVPALTTCGAAWGKKPIGKIIRSDWYKSDWSCGGGGKCDVTLFGIITYGLPTKLPNGKPWKFDLVRFGPKPAKAGFGAIPSVGIEVIK